MPNKKDTEQEICCSFCGKTQDEVTRLVEGPGVYICDNCIEFCNTLLFHDEAGAKPKKKGKTEEFVLPKPAEIKELAFGYDHCYKNSVKTLFLRDLYTVLWSLLFVIPGIIKAYEYRMMPYILADDPTLPTSEVFAQSRAMMKGNKWKAFVLDLSFIGWHILSLFTAGLLSTFYVRPYQLMTNAALYEALKYEGSNGESTVWTES